MAQVKATKGITLTDLAVFFYELFGDRNSTRLLSLGITIDFFDVALADLRKAIRKGCKKEILEIALARCVSRIFCISHQKYKLHLLLTEAMCQKYPKEKCAYCQNRPCTCPKENRKNIQLEIDPIQQTGQLEWSLKDWQGNLCELYGDRNKKEGVEEILNRLSEEVSEIRELEKTSPTSKKTNDEIKMKFARELSDALAWVIAVANFLEIDLELAVLNRFGNGCQTCGKMKCECGPFSFKLIDWEDFS